MITPAYGITAQQNVSPKLLLDFTSASLDARVTLTRALNTATCVNSSGLVSAVNANLPRFDYDPIALTCRGLLVEESKTNIVTYSESFNVNTAGAWSGNSGIVIVSNTADTTAPDNSNNADRLTAASANGFIFNPTALTATVVYSYSVFVKAGTASRVRVNVFDTSDHYAVFTLTGAGSVGTVVGIISSRVSAFPNGWYRCAITFTSGGSANAQVRVLLPDAGSIYAWGAQVEVGQLTSYVANLTTGTTTRNADVAVMTSTNFSDWFNAAAGTFRVDGISPASGTRPLISADDNTANESLVILTDGTAPKFIVKDGGSEVANVSAGTITANAAMFAYASYATDYFGIARPTARQVDTSGAVPTVDRLRIGANQAGNYLNGHVQKIAFWP